MFQTIGRIVMILLVAAIIAGGLYALVQNSGMNNSGFNPDRQIGTQNTVGGTQPQQFRENDRNRSASLGRGLGGVLGHMIEIGVITGIVLLVQKTLAQRKHPQVGNITS